MRITQELVHFVEYNNTSYIRLSRNTWLRLYGESYEPQFDSTEEEKAFQKQRIDDFNSDKHA